MKTKSASYTVEELDRAKDLGSQLKFRSRFIILSVKYLAG